MTVKELQELYYLDKAIKYEKDRLDDLRAALDLHSPGLSDMPKTPGARDKVGDIVPEIVDQEAQIVENIRKYTEMKEKLIKYINSIPFVRIKMIMNLRFIDKKTWQEVADYLDNGTGKVTADSVRMAVNSYLDRETG